MRRGYTLLCGCCASALVIAASAQAAEIVTYSYDALGRLVQTSIAGGPNNGIAAATCFDPAGNRTNYSSGTGAPASCGSSPTPSPTPTPSGNQPPVTTNDTYGLQCYTNGSVNLTANDTDPENNVPLVLQSISVSSDPSGTGTFATVTSASTVAVYGGGKGVTTFTYTVADSLGATSTGQLTVTTFGTQSACGGGGGPEP